MAKNEQDFMSKVGSGEIAGEYYVRGQGAFEAAPDHPSLATLMLCVLVLKNGACVVGESRSLNIDTFDEGTGRDYAKQDALLKVSLLRNYPTREELVYAVFKDEDAVKGGR